MRMLMTTAVSAALLAGVSAASAQMGTPGAGQPGQDQRPDDAVEYNQSLGSPPSSDKPAATTGSGSYDRGGPYAGPRLRRGPAYRGNDYDSEEDMAPRERARSRR